jgi:hypothetical protein
MKVTIPSPNWIYSQGRNFKKWTTFILTTYHLYYIKIHTNRFKEDYILRTFHTIYKEVLLSWDEKYIIVIYSFFFLQIDVVIYSN